MYQKVTFFGFPDTLLKWRYHFVFSTNGHMTSNFRPFLKNIMSNARIGKASSLRSWKKNAVNNCFLICHCMLMFFFRSLFFLSKKIEKPRLKVTEVGRNIVCLTWNRYVCINRLPGVGCSLWVTAKTDIKTTSGKEEKRHTDVRNMR